MTLVVDEGAGRPVVLLHGWGVRGAAFDPLRPLLRPHCRLLIPDLPGHGEARVPDERPTLATVATTVDRLLAGLNGVVLAGWSMGALAALEYVARYGSHRLAGLVIIDMTAKPLNDADWDCGVRGGFDAATNALALTAIRSDWPRQAAAIAAGILPEGVEPTEEDLTRTAGWSAGVDPEAMASLWQSMMDADHRATLRAVPVPVLVVAGGRSRIYAPKVARWMADAPADGRLVVLPEAGHGPTLDDPAVFADAVTAFLKSLEEPSRPAR